MNRLSVFNHPLLAFGCVSFAAVALGAVVCEMSGVATSLWARNLGAWALGALVAIALARWAGRRAVYVAAVLAVLGLGATLLSPGLDGVHRWLLVGPVRINAAFVFLPSLVVATPVLIARSGWGWLPAMLALLVLGLQPDASQATALALAIGVLAATARSHRLSIRVAVAAAAGLVAAWTWTRPDPLQPVPEVEEIIQLAAGHSPLLALAGVMLLAALAAAPFLATRRRDSDDAARTAGLALSALFVAWAIAPALGAYPTPLIGVGLSPILGAWIGIGLLAALERRKGG